MKSINSNKDFNNLVKGNKPVLLDFYADWCGPCQVLLPTVEKLAKEYKGKVEIQKVNVDKHPELSAKFGVRSIPTLVFIKDMNVVEQLKGGTSEGTLRKKLDAILK